MAQRLFNLSDVVEQGDYAVVLMQRGDYQFHAVLVGSGDNTYLLHNERFHHGSCPLSSTARRFRFSYSWYTGDISSTLESALTIDDFGSDMKLVRIIVDDSDEFLTSAGRSYYRGSNIDDAASGLMKDGYEKQRIFRGQSGWHSHHGSYLNRPIGNIPPYMFGVEMEVEFDEEDDLEDFKEVPSNWFYRERDGSLDDYGCEIITIPLLPQDAKDPSFWLQLTDRIKTLASASSNCGLHVHVSREILGTDGAERRENLGKLLYLYHHFIEETRLNRAIFGRDHGYHAYDGKTDEGKAVKMFGSKLLQNDNIKQKVHDAMVARSRQERYFDINITNDNTFEFRKGAGTTDENVVAMLVEYCELMCLYAKQVKWQKISYEDFVNYLQKRAKGVLLISKIQQFQ